MSKTQEVAKAVESGKVKLIADLVQEALDAGDEPAVILNEGMIAAMSVVGSKLHTNEISLPEMLAAAKTMKRGMELLKPHLPDGSTSAYGTYIIGTVAGDLHDVCKNFVALMLASIGFKVLDLGVDVSSEKFIGAVKDNPDCKAIGLFVSMTTTMATLRSTIQEMIAAGWQSQVKIMIGGAHITQSFADVIGADAYIADPGEAATKAVELVTRSLV